MKVENPVSDLFLFYILVVGLLSVDIADGRLISLVQATPRVVMVPVVVVAVVIHESGREDWMKLVVWIGFGPLQRRSLWSCRLLRIAFRFS